jgi:geranyl-CoA carboxylase beta subunit
MAFLTSSITRGDVSFAANRRDMLQLLDELRSIEHRIEELSAKRRSQFEKRGQLLPRDRLGYLLDRGSPFVELSTIAGLGMHDDNGRDQVMGGCVITGIGYVSGVRCVVVIHDSGIKGGIIQPIGVRKVLRAQQMAYDNNLPCVYLVESGGGNLHHQFESFSLGGGMFRNLSRLSAKGLPQISVVHGSSTAGGAYLPGLSDYVIMVRNRARVFLAGPPLLKAATGEIATDEALGGADMHGSVSGVCDYVVDSDREGIDCARRIVASLGWRGPGRAAEAVKPPRYDPDELAGVVPVDFKRGYDVREVVARIVDDSEFNEFKAGIGVATVCGQSRIDGHAAALIGNNGPINAEGAAKAAQFIQLMCQAGTPIIYLQNITGFMVGTEVEQRGIVKHGAKMIQAISNATVPQITLLIGASFGAGNYGMCGRGFEPRFIFAWPNNRTATMGGEQAARVMTIVAEGQAERSGKPLNAEHVAANERKLIDQFNHESMATYASARLFDDGIIDPRDTRRMLAFCLATCRDAEAAHLHANTFGVARL